MSSLGLSTRELKRYSLLKAISAAGRNELNAAGLEMEASRAEYQRRGKMPSSPHAFIVPDEVFKRDLTVATSNAGGFLVDTQNDGFIELLRPRSVVMGMGAQLMTGMVGNVTVPRQTGAATAYWLANEAAAITESQMTIGQLALSPKTVGAYTEVSRQLTLQSSPSAEALIRNDLAQVLALEVDRAAIQGSGGSGQPTGLLTVSGVGSVAGASLDYTKLLEFQSDVAAANALAPGCAYVTTPTVAVLLKGRQRFSGTDTPVWQGAILDGTIEGFAARSTTQMPAATMIFGDWSQIVIAEWGGLELAVNPYAAFQSGVIGVRAMYSIDVGVRYPGAFSVATSIT